MKSGLKREWDETPMKGLFPQELKSRMWKKIHKAAIGKTRHSYKWVAAASIVLLLSAIGYQAYFIQDTAVPTIITQTYPQDIRLLRLPDGTRVWVNENTKIEYPTEFVGDTRNVSLEGEAFFEVKRDPAKPFIITSGLIKTTVLGTSFNVKAYRGTAPLVEVRTGKVKVENENSEVFLEKGEAGVYMPTSEILVKQKAKRMEPGYRRMLIDIDGLSLEEVVKKLQADYTFAIEYVPESLKSLKLKGMLDTRQGIKGMLETLAFALNAQIKETGSGNYIISQKY